VIVDIALRADRIEGVVDDLFPHLIDLAAEAAHARKAGGLFETHRRGFRSRLPSSMASVSLSPRATSTCSDTPSRSMNVKPFTPERDRGFSRRQSRSGVTPHGPRSRWPPIERLSPAHRTGARWRDVSRAAIVTSEAASASAARARCRDEQPFGNVILAVGGLEGRARLRHAPAVASNRIDGRELILVEARPGQLPCCAFLFIEQPDERVRRTRRGRGRVVQLMSKSGSRAGSATAGDRRSTVRFETRAPCPSSVHEKRW
jgi:hypothetical protein